MIWPNCRALPLVLLALPAAAQVDEWARLDAQAGAQYRSGDYAAALASARQALLLAEREPDRAVGAARQASSLNLLALAEQAEGRYAEAQELLQRALTVSSAVLPAGHPNVVALRANLDSLQEARRARETAQRAHRAQELNEQALAHHGRGEYAQAALLYEQALPLVVERFGAGSAEHARVLASLADTHAARRQYQQAVELYRQALDIFAQHAQEWAARAAALNALAAVYYVQRQYAQAEPLFRHALQIQETGLGPQHPDLLPVLDNLVALYRTTQRERQAEPFSQRARLIRKAHGLPSP